MKLSFIEWMKDKDLHLIESEEDPNNRAQRVIKAIRIRQIGRIKAKKLRNEILELKKETKKILFNVRQAEAKGNKYIADQLYDKYWDNINKENKLIDQLSAMKMES